MVDLQEETLQATQELIIYVAGCGYFAQKREIIEALVAAEKSLEEDPEFKDGIEDPWSD